MIDIIERLEQVRGDNEDAREAAAEIRQLRSDVEHWKTEDANGVVLVQCLSAEVEQLIAENLQLQEQIDTCRELRKYDRIEIERLRMLLEKR